MLQLRLQRATLWASHANSSSKLWYTSPPPKNENNTIRQLFTKTTPQPKPSLTSTLARPGQPNAPKSVSPAQPRRPNYTFRPSPSPIQGDRYFPSNKPSQTPSGPAQSKSAPGPAQPKSAPLPWIQTLQSIAPKVPLQKGFIVPRGQTSTSVTQLAEPKQPVDLPSTEENLPKEPKKKAAKKKPSVSKTEKYWKALSSKATAERLNGQLPLKNTGEIDDDNDDDDDIAERVHHVEADAMGKVGNEEEVVAGDDSPPTLTDTHKGSKPPVDAASSAPAPVPKEKRCVPRPPVVTIMGHVDHGKTTILDRLRNAHVAEAEVGGITQSIGAFTVQLAEGSVTFIDTPGHEAFKEMRQAGVLVTDIIVIVIAASEGIMPQTREVIELAQWQHLPIVIALNKIDLGSNLVDRILRDLQDTYDLDLEPFGGRTQVVKVSALRGQGLNDLVQAIALEAEMAELKAEIDCPAEGVVLESRKDMKQGTMVSIIVRKGHVRVGDWVVAGAQCHRIRTMRDDRGQEVEVAGPSSAVELIGLKAPLPEPCSKLLVLDNERQARKMAKERSELAKEDLREQFYEELEKLRLGRRAKQESSGKAPKILTPRGNVDLKAKYQQKFLNRHKDVTPQSAIPTFSVIIKADVAGTLHAIEKMVKELDCGNRVAVEIVKSGVGPVTEQEMEMARLAKAAIVTFNVGSLCKEADPKVHQFDIIYRALDFIKQGMAECLEPIEVTNVLGSADVKQLFVLNTKKSNGQPAVVAGCHVHAGVIQKSKEHQCRVLRNTKVVHVGSIQSLKVYQNETSKVAHGSDCGILLEGDFEPLVGDVIQTIITEKRPHTVAEVFGST